MGRQPSHSYSLSVGFGQIAANEYAVVIKPRTWAYDSSAPGAIYAPALSAGAWNLTGWLGAFNLARRGIIVVASDLGDTPSIPYTFGTPPSVGGTGTGGPGVWGNDASMTKLTAVYNYLMNTLKAASPKVLLLGGSHGGATACRWAAQNPAKVAALLLGIGCVDIQDVLTNDRGGYRASIQQAYGLGSGVVLPAGVTGIASAPSFTFPCRTYYSDDDNVTPAARQAAFVAANPSRIESLSIGAVGHLLTTMPWEDSTQWLMDAAGY